jgi:hypothetical protein
VESQDPPNIIDPKRIIRSIPYGEITEMTTDTRGYEICTKERSMAFSFTVDEVCFGVLYHFMSHILGDEIVFPGYTPVIPENPVRPASKPGRARNQASTPVLVWGNQAGH